VWRGTGGRQTPAPLPTSLHDVCALTRVRHRDVFRRATAQRRQPIWAGLFELHRAKCAPSTWYITRTLAIVSARGGWLRGCAQPQDLPAALSRTRTAKHLPRLRGHAVRSLCCFASAGPLPRQPRAAARAAAMAKDGREPRWPRLCAYSPARALAATIVLALVAVQGCGSQGRGEPGLCAYLPVDGHHRRRRQG